MNRLTNHGPKGVVTQAIRPDPTIHSYPPAAPSGSNGPDTTMLQLAAGKNVDIAPGGPPSQPASLSAYHQPSQPQAVARTREKVLGHYRVRACTHACMHACLCAGLRWCKAPHHN